MLSLRKELFKPFSTKALGRIPRGLWKGECPKVDPIFLKTGPKSTSMDGFGRGRTGGKG